VPYQLARGRRYQRDAPFQHFDFLGYADLHARTAKWSVNIEDTRYGPRLSREFHVPKSTINGPLKLPAAYQKGLPDHTGLPHCIPATGGRESRFPTLARVPRRGVMKLRHG
jgi:hypothetical protein